MNVDDQLKLLSWGSDKIISSEELKEKLINSQKNKKPLIVKLGVDPTAPDIHFGHTVVLRKLRQFQDCGHQAVLLIGGFTSQIGDPSGKSKTRPPLSVEEVKENARTYLEQVKKILNQDTLQVVDNSTWLNELSLKDVIKLLSHGTMSKILEHNTFKDRFNNTESIRMHEFIYPFLQAYDSIHLQADVELGGTDQLFNIAFGRELQKEFNQSPQCAILMPILTGTDGSQKMSKSLNNYIGVNESPIVMTQKLLNMPDSNIVLYFKLLTNTKPEKVIEIENELKKNPDTKTVLDFKNMLIDEIISIYHPGMSKNDTDVFNISPDDCENKKLNITKALTLTNFVKSNREAVQLIQSGAIKIDETVITDRLFMIDLSNPVLLKAGKKRIVKLVFG